MSLYFYFKIKNKLNNIDAGCGCSSLSTWSEKEKGTYAITEGIDLDI